jgi:hypothetical protein
LRSSDNDFETETPASPPSGRKSPVIIMSPVSRFNVIMEAAKEMNIEVLNPSAEVLEAAFDVFYTPKTILKRAA